MTIQSLSLLVVLATVLNIACIVLLGIATHFTVRNYRVLRRMQERATSSHDATVRNPKPRPEPSQRTPARSSQRYDSLDVPDRGQAEWTGPVTPYIPADRAKPPESSASSG